MIRPNSTPAARQGTTAASSAVCPGALSRYAWRRIRRKAAWLAARPGFTRFDQEDIEQELALRLWQGLGNFDPAKGNAEAFITTVLRRAGNSLLRRRCSRRRGARRVHRTLDGACRPDDEQLIGEDPSARLSTPASSHEGAFDLVHDVAVVLEQLPSDLRDLASQLQRRSVTEVAQHMGLSRSTVYLRIRQLRARFAAAGLNEFP